MYDISVEYESLLTVSHWAKRLLNGIRYGILNFVLLLLRLSIEPLNPQTELKKYVCKWQFNSES